MNSAKSSWGLEKSGVPQGSIQSRVLFNIFINHLHDRVCYALSELADDSAGKSG